MNSKLTLDSITFGKYKGVNINTMLKDRNYCKWLIKQPWLKEQYEHLYNKINSYKPTQFFFIDTPSSNNFLDTYQYFNLIPLEELQITLNEQEKQCYEYYLLTLQKIKEKILQRIDNKESNIYDIKAPVKWLKQFENTYNINRHIFKDFLHSYELQNITKIIEDIKKKGGIEYKGDKAYKIAKENSLKQELFWYNILKHRYGDKISSQFKFNNCIFDFINISSNTIYECKLNIKDFDEKQYNKYISVLDSYQIIYLISNDCVIDIKNLDIYTTNNKYVNYFNNITNKNTKFELFIKSFKLTIIDDIKNTI